MEDKILNICTGLTGAGGGGVKGGLDLLVHAIMVYVNKTHKH